MWENIKISEALYRSSLRDTTNLQIKYLSYLGMFCDAVFSSKTWHVHVSDVVLLSCTFDLIDL